MSEKETLPLITIGVSAYNRKDYLRECLNSLLVQTYKNCEIIVVDDGSVDGTGDMVRNEFPQVRYIYQENAGDAAAKNTAAFAARGEYIVFNDSDDLFYPDAVERLYNALGGRKGVCSYGGYTAIDGAGNILPTKKKMPVLPGGNIVEPLLKQIMVYNCGFLMPVELFCSMGGYQVGMKGYYDYKLALNIAAEYPIFAEQEPVFYRRRHDSNISAHTYDKIMVGFHVFDDFISEHPEVAAKYPDTVRKRYAKIHILLAREARKEKRDKSLIKHHCREALKNHFSLKHLWRYLFW
ncbi:MAG: glycosyltransferase family 2 protein [Lentisphaeria bacterium]|nr:glycosyltransferase family 2 protein [Lentisphaeria bacterium]